MTDDSYSSTHPPLPPTTEDGRLAWLRLLRSRRVGVATFWRLLGEHGDAATALDALPEVARAAGVDQYRPCPEGVVLAEMKAARKAGARLVCAGAPDYPALLRSIDDAPPALWVVGDVSVLHRPTVAVVGARSASSLGLRMARIIAEDLAAAGLTVVSGLARGIDTAAHEATVDAGTVAVLAGGVDVLYPRENADLARRIADAGGARVSEQPMGLQPMARHFPARNRIISGLAHGVVVIEAAARSGSLITARTALDQGREVMAVPGHPLDGRAGGCNLLIRDGARLVRGAQDVLDALPPGDADPAPDPGRGQAVLDLREPAASGHPVVARPEKPERGLRDTAALHRQILSRLSPSPLPEDQLIRDLDAAPGQVAPALTELELEGRVQRQPGGLLSIPGPS